VSIGAEEKERRETLDGGREMLEGSRRRGGRVCRGLTLTEFALAIDCCGEWKSRWRLGSYNCCGFGCWGIELRGRMGGSNIWKAQQLRFWKN
jgi:hypothetical protein